MVAVGLSQVIVLITRRGVDLIGDWPVTGPSLQILDF